ncbi:hypothetical protein GcM3_122007 [Golovinomyces cichoracearum]|uniref:Uncharacterized protein n=1 Tax=Golovinomyces cichoracearum TaxID=62708 RepID=A0A420I6X7_9PEZI|nr:hypothetical protein GcM3_122007 [Golovinomyces cichoracearum]
MSRRGGGIAKGSTRQTLTDRIRHSICKHHYAKASKSQVNIVKRM